MSDTEQGFGVFYAQRKGSVLIQRMTMSLLLGFLKERYRAAPGSICITLTSGEDCSFVLHQQRCFSFLCLHQNVEITVHRH